MTSAVVMRAHGLCMGRARSHREMAEHTRCRSPLKAPKLRSAIDGGIRRRSSWGAPIRHCLRTGSEGTRSRARIAHVHRLLTDHQRRSRDAEPPKPH